MDWKTVVKEAQANSGFTQLILAKQLGCSQASISDLERGRTREPRYSIGQKLLSLAGYPTTSLPTVQRSSAQSASPDIEAAAAGQGA